MYRGFTSYEQAEWLRNTLLVKRISRLVSQSGSVRRHVAMTSQEKDSADTQKSVCETCLYLSPQGRYAKRIQPGKGQHGCTAVLTTGKLRGCVAHARRQESATRHQL